jgi:hypothetical protein
MSNNTLNLKRRPRFVGISRLLLRPETWRLVVAVARSIVAVIRLFDGFL